MFTGRQAEEVIFCYGGKCSQTVSAQQRVIVLAPALEMRNEAMTGSNNLNFFMFLSMSAV